MRAFIYSNTARVIIFALIALSAVWVACADKGEDTGQHVFTSDELYLIESYAQVRRAGAHFSTQPQLADSLLEGLAGTIDSARVARTITKLNTTPERWVPVFEEIEKRLRETDKKPPSEQSSS